MNLIFKSNCITSKKLSIISGLICGLGFAPCFFIPSIFTFSILCAQIANARSLMQAMIFSYLFGAGFFLTSLYWIAFGVSVYIDEFWWAIPFALIGLPAFLAIFVALHAAIIWPFRNHPLYHFLFCCCWVLIEWIISWIFTGIPWCMIGYMFSISEILIQSASVFGVVGLSFVSIYIGTSLYSRNMLHARLIISLTILIIMCVFGLNRLNTYPTQFSKIMARIVQPSIPQTSKWDDRTFWDNLNKHIKLSKQNSRGNIIDDTQSQIEPDIIIWSEAALTAPYHYPEIYNHLMSSFSANNQILLFGGVNDNNQDVNSSVRTLDAIALQEKKMHHDPKGYKIYSSLIAMNNHGAIVESYNKSHLVPFGEYIPFANYLPIKKLTAGLLDYTPGSRKIIYLESLNLRIDPLICYESIFYDEIRISNDKADTIINITNDAWYGNSSGPYQHFEISRMRAIENGLPMIRVANNGISAIIDPLGRVVSALSLDYIGIIDGYIPLKLNAPTLYSVNGYLNLLICALSILFGYCMIVFRSHIIKLKLSEVVPKN